MTTSWTEDRIRTQAQALGPWFHNIDLNGVRTAPEHFLGDFPQVKWERFRHCLPEDLSGRTVLDIGCNAGFYSMEMKRRGADRVLGIDFDADYLKQARFAAEVRGMDIEFRQMSVYDVGALREKFDLVFFIGVLYHLRHPLLALDLIHEHVAGDLMVFQSLQRGSNDIATVAEDYDFFEQAPFDEPGYRSCTSSSTATRTTIPIGGRPTGPARRPCCARPGSPSRPTRRRRSSSAAGLRPPTDATGRSTR